MTKYENEKPVWFGDYINFIFLQIIPRSIAIIIIYNICKEVINYKYYLFVAFSIVAILQYKFSFIIYTLYVSSYEDDEKFGEYEILYELAELSWNKYNSIFRYKNSFVVKSILSERKVFYLADQYGASIMTGQCHTLLHPSMKFEHKKFYNQLLEIHEKKILDEKLNKIIKERID